MSNEPNLKETIHEQQRCVHPQDAGNTGGVEWRDRHTDRYSVTNKLHLDKL